MVGLHSDGAVGDGDSFLALLSYGEQELSVCFHVEKTSSSYSLVIYAFLVSISDSNPYE